MSRMEEVLRAATRETAAEVLPDSIPPLDAATLPVPRRLVWRVSGPLAPLYAAVAVLLVAALSVTLATVLPAPRPASAFAGVPAYYVALTATGTPAGSYPAELTVRSTFSGAVLATVTAPRPYGTFVLVDGTGDDRTFLVAARAWRPADAGAVPTRLFWLRFDPASGLARLAPLPLPQFNGEWMRSASVSPDGTRVAVLFTDLSTLTDTLRVYTLRSGAERAWSISAASAGVLPGIGVAPYDPAAIAWGADDRTISWVWSSNPMLGVYDLNTTRAGGDLDYASIWGLTGWGGSMYGAPYVSCESDPFRSANGQYFLCGGYELPESQWGSAGKVPVGPVIQGFIVFEGGLQSQITIAGAKNAPLKSSAMTYLLWASPDASTLIGLIDGHAVVVSDGQTRPIPWPAGVVAPPGSSFPGIAW